MSMKLTIWILAVATLLAGGTANAVTKVWNNPAGGYWFDSQNWTPPGSPQWGDDVIITLAGIYTVEINDDASIGSLTLGGATGVQTLDAQYGLSLSAEGVVNQNGRLIIGQYGDLYITTAGAIASDNEFTNYGVVTFNSSSALYLSTGYGNGTVFTNQAGGLVQFVGNTTVQFDYGTNVPSYFENYGTVTKTGVGLLDIQLPFYNRNLGTFSLESGQVNSCYFDTDGYLGLLTGTVFRILQYDSNKTMVIDTLGEVELFGNACIFSGESGENIINNGDVRHTGTETGVIDAEFEGLGMSDLGDIFVDEGVLQFAGNHNLTFKDTVQIGPQAELIVNGNGEFVENCRIMCAVPDSGTFTLGSPAFHFVWYNIFTFSGEFNLHGPGTVQFYPSSGLDTFQVIRADSGIVFNSDQTIYTFALELNGGTMNADIVVIGSQIWESGGLGDGGGDSVVIQQGGTLEVLGPDAKSMDGSTLNINGNANFNGSGLITLTNGANIIVSATGVVTIGDSVTITSPTDSLINSGELTINSPLDTSVLDLFIYNFVPFSRTPGTIDILGKSRTSRGGTNDGVVELQPDLARDAASTEWFISYKFTNNGLIIVNNDCQIVVEDTLVNSASGVIDIYGDGGLAGNGVVINGGQINSNGVILSMTNREITPSVINLADSGFIDVLADTLTLAGGGVNYGDIEIHAGTVLVIQGVFENAAGGLIHGNGTLDVSGATFTNNGTISPGASPGIMQIVGDVACGATSILHMEIRGTAPSQDYDKLQVSGNLIVDGTLALHLQNGFIPAEDDTLELLTYSGFSGDFAEVTGAELPDGRFLHIEFGPTGLKNFVCTQAPEFQASVSSIHRRVPSGQTAYHTFEICNTGVCPLGWDATWVQLTPAQPSPPWISLTAGGDNDARPGKCREMTIRFVTGELPLGFYEGYLQFATNVNGGEIETIPVTFEVQDENLPVELSSFTAVAGPNRVTLNWSTASETNVSNFEITRDGSLLADIPAANNATGHNYSWADIGLVNSRTYSYELASVDLDGARTNHGTVEATPVDDSFLPTGFWLAQNFPNPFNATTTIEYNLPEATKISLKLFDLAGREIEILASGTQAAGRHTVSFEASNLPSGLYFYRLESPGKSLAHKMVLLK